MEFLNILEKNKMVYEGFDFWSHIPGFPTFGGQLAAQSLYAGLKTCRTNAVPTSIHTLFINPGNISRPVQYEVTDLKQGKHIEMREVKAIQDDRIICTTTISCSVPEVGSIHSISKKKVPHQDTYMSLDSYIRKGLNLSSDFKLENAECDSSSFQERSTLEMKYSVLSSNFSTLFNSFKIDMGTYSENRLQIKITFLVDCVSSTNITTFLTFISDLLMFETVLLSLNLSVFSKEIANVASIDHNIYFINPTLPEDRTVYYIVSCKSVKESKAVIDGKMVDKDGNVICTVAQQALIRCKNK